MTHSLDVPWTSTPKPKWTDRRVTAADHWIRLGYFRRVEKRVACTMCGCLIKPRGAGQHLKNSHWEVYQKHAHDEWRRNL